MLKFKNSMIFELCLLIFFKIKTTKNLTWEF